MSDLLAAHCPPQVTSLPGARANIPPEAREAFDDLAEDCRRCLCATGTEDSIAVVRSWEQAELLVPGRGVLPHLGEVSFTDESTLRERLETFLSHPGRREQITAAQRAGIRERLSYESGMRRTIETIRERLTAGKLSIPAGQPWPRGVAA
jgi:hypothetical protein